MKLYIMKQDALEMLKANLPALYSKYYTEPDNKWIAEIYGDDPFVEFKEVPNFDLAELDSDLTPGEIDLRNCKIIYEKLQFLSESQASDERLWAGLTHSTFYGYMRRRWGYGYTAKPKTPDKEAGILRSRFFFRGGGRNGFYRNTIAKCWWVGHNTYDPANMRNHFERLDIIGSNDLNSKITEFFYNFTFSSNPSVLGAIIESLRSFKLEDRKLAVREHIRPALTYMNAVGGSVVIDCLEPETITEIFTDAIETIMQGDTPSLDLSAALDPDETGENDDDPEEPLKRVVVPGCKIIVHDKHMNPRAYVYNYDNDVVPPHLKPFTDRGIGDDVLIDGEFYTIQDIIYK